MATDSLEANVIAKKARQTYNKYRDEMEEAVIYNKTDKLVLPDEHVIKTALTHKLMIIDETKLDTIDIDWSHFDFLLGIIDPKAFQASKNMDGEIGPLKVLWSALSPYLKTLIKNYHVANEGIKAVESDLQELVADNVTLIEFLKLEDKFGEYKDYRKHKKEQEDFTGTDI